jgi:4-carboxymuconolactone decarboxylase
MNETEIQQKYLNLLGRVPSNIENRFKMAKMADRLDSILTIEDWRDRLIYQTNSTPAIQQLIHFSLLIGSKDWSPAKLHALGALKAGAAFTDLWTVCETAAITGGMPMFSNAVEILSQAYEEFKSLEA